MSTAVTTVIGRLTKDVERANDRAPYKTSLALDGGLKKGKTYETKYLQLDIWENTTAGQMIVKMAGKGKSITKGSLVAVTGVPTYELYTKNDGSEGSRDGINVALIDFINVGNKAAPTETSQSSQSTNTNTSENSGSTGGLELEEDFAL